MSIGLTKVDLIFIFDKKGNNYEFYSRNDL